jgi:hypothetical protein
MKELLALPTNNGVAHQETRMASCSSTIVNRFPRTIRHCQLKPLVNSFMARQQDTGRIFRPPSINRIRQNPTSSEAQLVLNVWTNVSTRLCVAEASCLLPLTRFCSFAPCVCSFSKSMSREIEF